MISTTTTTTATTKAIPTLPWTLLKDAKIDTFQSSTDGIHLTYASLLHKDKTRPTIVFLTGWKETFAYYEELFHHLFVDKGFNVFTMDHRSQGLSDDHPGMLSEQGHPDGSGTRICHVDDFETSYVADAAQFLQDIVKPTVAPGAPVCLIGFSMGGILATRLGQKPETASLFDRLVAVCPMYRHKNTLDVGGMIDIEMPMGFARKLASGLTSLGLGKTKADGRDTHASLPTTDLLTHCPVRLAKFDSMRKNLPNIVLAGCSWGWVHASFLFEDLVLSEGPKNVKVPTLVVQAEDDSFVYNSAHCEFVAACTSGKMRLVGPVSGAYHQLWMEKDAVRQPFVDAIATFAKGDNDKEANEKISAIPVVQSSSEITVARWPQGHHSGSSPPWWPVPLLFRERRSVRDTVGLVWKGAFLAVMVHCVASALLMHGRREEHGERSR